MSLHSSALLSPPQTPTTPNDSPFQPKEGDNVSLSMKRRRKGHSDIILELHRACPSNNDLRASFSSRSSVHYLQKSKSLPSLRGKSAQSRSKVNSPANVAKSACSERSRRRWTLPSKAAPTRGLINGVSAFCVSAESKKKVSGEDESPAMITLRRATCSQPSRQMSITFFPEPKFQRNKSSFLSSFLDTITGAGSKSVLDIDAIHRQETRRSSRSASVDGSKAQPSNSESAATVCTEVSGLEPRLSIPGQKNEDLPLRRCSTRFISAGSVYEVIWDENGSSTTSDSSPTPPEHSPNDRRLSVAMEQLETHLSKGEAQSRRESVAAQAQLNRRSAVANYHSRDCQPSLGEMLTFKFSLPGNDGFLSSLPRSKTSSRAGGVPTRDDMPSEAHEEFRPNKCDGPLSGIEFFPPLRNRVTTNPNKVTSRHTVDAQTFDSLSACNTMPPQSIFPGTPSQSGEFGSIVGFSTHVEEAQHQLIGWTDAEATLRREQASAGEAAPSSTREEAERLKMTQCLDSVASACCNSPCCYSESTFDHHT